MRTALLAFLLLAGCTEYDLSGTDKPERPQRPDDPEEEVDTEDSGDPAPPDSDPPDDTEPPVDETRPVADAGPDQNVNPLDTVLLDGTGSYDPGGNTPLTYDWDLLSRPSGSTADISWLQTLSTPFFFADLAGDYVFQLTVKNSLGIKSDPDQVKITAKPTDGFYVQVSWDTAPTDIDLHLINANTEIFKTPNDCCYCSMWPEWGASGTSDNPSLDWDDTDGYGPETATIDAPTNGTYRVLLHFYGENQNASCDGPCQRTKCDVKIYSSGVELDHFQVTLSDQGDVVEVATMEWPSKTITFIDDHSTTTRTMCF